MRVFRKIKILNLLFMAWFVLQTVPLFSGSDDFIAAKLDIDFDSQSVEPRKFHGSITYKFPSSPKNNEVCIYLPFNDPFYGNNYTNIVKTNISAAKNGGNLYFYGGTTEVDIENRSYQIKYINETILKISRQDFHSQLTINFKSTMPRMDKSDDKEWFFDTFYPILLENCDISNTRIFENQFHIPLNFDIKINTPKSWKIIAPKMYGKSESETYRISNFIAKKFSFALVRENKRKDLNIAGIPISVFYHSDSFESLFPTISNAIEPTIHWLGQNPYNEITVFESLEMQSDSTPGMVIFNRPRQASFDSFQTNYTNWRDWILTSMIISQWARSANYEKYRKDSWLLQGLVDFITLKIISKNFEKIDFFKESDDGFKLFSSTYRHTQDMLASLLSTQDPLGTLTDNNFVTIKNYEDQNPLIYIKHAIALRQLEDYMTDNELRDLLISFLHENRYKAIEPQDFIRHIYNYKKVSDLKKQSEIVKQIRQWWTKSGWPDFELTQIEKTELSDGTWLINVEFVQNSDLDIPAKVLFEDIHHNKFLVTSSKSNELGSQKWIASLAMKHELKDVTIDPEFASFDNDRFNNTSATPGMKFFPGNAETLSETDYTTFWFPYAYRNLGEPTSIAIAGAVFKHINQGIFFKFAGTVSDQLGLFDISHRRSLPNYALRVSQSISQDYLGSRTALLSIDRKPIFNFEPKIGLSLKLRYRQTVGQPESIHYTYSTTLSSSKANIADMCHTNLSSDFEHAPEELSRSFSYARLKSEFLFGCSFFRRNSLSFRLFRGQITGKGNYPELVKFRINDSTEAGVSIDDNSIQPTQSVFSGSTHLSLPLWLPYLTNSIILSRKLNISFFYDYGKYLDSSSMYFKASGSSITLPIGGDIAGANSVTISSLHLSTVYYTNINGSVSNTPHFLFGLSGNF